MPNEEPKPYAATPLVAELKFYEIGMSYHFPPERLERFVAHMLREYKIKRTPEPTK